MHRVVRVPTVGFEKIGSPLWKPLQYGLHYVEIQIRALNPKDSTPNAKVYAVGSEKSSEPNLKLQT